MISVIVPAYNAEKTIEACINSILAQSFEDFELLVVDDGSTDGTAKIALSMAAQNPKIKVLQKQNGGVSFARNAGIENAAGKYIAFVDSDDTVPPNFLQELLAAAKPGTVPAAAFGGAKAFEEKTFAFGENFAWDYFCGELEESICYSACNKLFEKDLIKKANLCFDEDLSTGEDMLFTYNYLCLCKGAVLTGKTYYCYNAVEGSATRTKKDYYPAYAKLFEKMAALPGVEDKTLCAWAFEYAVFILSNPFYAGLSTGEFARKVKPLLSTPLFSAAKRDFTPKKIKRRLFFAALKNNGTLALWLLVKAQSLLNK